jgi:CxxC-x17-CxxC domain-containing protein
MSYEDKTLSCVDCGSDFAFTAREQEFYAEKGFENEPKRCADCRRKFKEAKMDRKSFEVVCADCGQTTTVPFEPKSDRPVYCRDCFAKHRDN